MFLKKAIKTDEMFNMSDWKYYSGAILPASAPHNSPYLSKSAKRDCRSRFHASQ